MKLVFHRKRIAGTLVVVPANERSFVADMKNFNFPESRSLKLKEVMGFDKRRVVGPGVCVSDLAVFGLEHLFERGWLKREEIDALIVVTQTPDYLIPGTSCIIHGRLGLKRDMISLSISQACTGFLIGLIQAFMMLEQESIKKVVLVNSDVLSRKVSPQDRNIYPLVGDACSITVLERDAEDSVIHANVRVDGSRASSLTIPAGGMRQPHTPETAKLEDAGDGNLRAKDHLFMDGAAIFNFVQTEVPPLIESVVAQAGASMDSVDYFLCHQPNRFMLQKLADKMKIPHARMPNNVVEHFGNNSGVTIPTVMTFNLGERLLREKLCVCLAGFGAGLTWAGMLLTIGKFDFNGIIEYK
ncbi:MAG: ketoacyl-ACP synthase III [Verrucomicrobiia bacterium]|jgi:3-oxoacyl-[acyl-carrier-protein] synthase-3